MRMKLTDKRIEKLRSEKTLEVWDMDLRGFGIRINRGGKRTFNVHTRVNGKKRRFVLGTYPYMSLDEARRRAECIIHGAPKGHRTFGDICEQFLVDYVRARQWRTKAQMERHIRHVLIPFWGDRQVASITRSEVRDFLRDYAKNGPIAANRLLAQLRKIFNWALDEELITSSPVTRLTPPAPERERDRVLSADEVGRLWSQFDGLGYPFGPLFQLLLTTGQRRGEVAKMRWSEIDGDVWHIPNERAKSGQGHAVPLTPLALSILAGIPRNGVYVFSTGKRPVSGFSKGKARVKGVDDWRLHDLRRTMATHMRRMGVDRITVSKILNHAEAGVTRVYDRYSCDDEQRQAMNLWSDKLNKWRKT